MLAAAVEMVNVVRAQAGGAPRHPEEAAESERDYPQKGRAAAAAGGPRLRAAPKEHPHPPELGVLGSSGSRRQGEKTLGRGALAHTSTAPAAAHRTRRALSSRWESRLGSFSPGLLLPKTIRDIASGGGSRQFRGGGRTGKPRAPAISSLAFPAAGAHGITLHSCEGYESAKRSPSLGNPQRGRSCPMSARWGEEKGCRSISQRQQSAGKSNCRRSSLRSSPNGRALAPRSHSRRTHSHSHSLALAHTPPDNNRAAPAISVL